MTDTAVQDLLVRIATDPLLARDIAADPGLLTSRYGLSAAQATQVAGTRIDASADRPRRLEERLSRAGGVFGSAVAAAIDTYAQESAAGTARAGLGIAPEVEAEMQAEAETPVEAETQAEAQTADPVPQPVDPEPEAVQPDAVEPEAAAQLAQAEFQAALEQVMQDQQAEDELAAAEAAAEQQDPAAVADDQPKTFQPPKNLDLTKFMMFEDNDLDDADFGGSGATGGVMGAEAEKFFDDFIEEHVEKAPIHMATGGATVLVDFFDSIFGGDEPADPRTVDSDGDGINDHDERQGGTNPLDADSDWDTIPDGQERAEGTDPTSEDSDRDLMPDAEEWERGTNPMVSDMDGDGYGDGFETRFLGTDPLNADTDGDLLPDRQEIQDGTDPLQADSDGDGVPDTFDRPMSASDPLPDLTVGPPPDLDDDTVEYGGSSGARPDVVVK